MTGPFNSNYGAYKYQSTESRTLGSITQDSFDYRDQAKLLSQLTGDISYMSAYMRKMQKGIDDANQNFVQQFQSLINDMAVIFGGGQGDTGFEWGDFGNLLQMVGALFGFDAETGVPNNANAAAGYFISQYFLSNQSWQDVVDYSVDNSIAGAISIFGEIPILGQSIEQLGVILSQMRDTNYTINTVLNQFFSSFGITPDHPTNTWSDLFNGLFGLYDGLAALFSDTNYGQFQPIFEQMQRWDQQVMDAIIKLTQGDISGLIGLIPISSLTNINPDLQINSNFDNPDALAGTSEWTYDSAVGHSSPGSARVNGDGRRHALKGSPVLVHQNDNLNPEVWVKWSGFSGNATLPIVRLQIRLDDGTDIDVAQLTGIGATGGWTKLSGVAQIPAGVTRGYTRIFLTEQALGGTFWFDDAPDYKSGSLIPEDWIQSLSQKWQGFLQLFGIDETNLMNPDPNWFWNWIINNFVKPAEVFAEQSGFNDLIDNIISAFTGGANDHTMEDLWAALNNIPQKNIERLAELQSGFDLVTEPFKDIASLSSAQAWQDFNIGLMQILGIPISTVVTNPPNNLPVGALPPDVPLNYFTNIYDELNDAIKTGDWWGLLMALFGQQTVGTALATSVIPNNMPQLKVVGLPTINSAIDQLGLLFQGSSVSSPANDMISDAIDWFAELLGFKTTTKVDAQNQQSFQIGTMTGGYRNPSWVSRHPIADVTFPEAMLTATQTISLDTGLVENRIAVPIPVFVHIGDSRGGIVTTANPTIYDTVAISYVRQSKDADGNAMAVPNNIFLDVFRIESTGAATRINSEEISSYITTLDSVTYLTRPLNPPIISQPGERYVVGLRNNSTVPTAFAATCLWQRVDAFPSSWLTSSDYPNRPPTGQASYTTAEVASASRTSGSTDNRMVFAVLATLNPQATDQLYSDDFNRFAMGGLWYLKSDNAGQIGIFLGAAAYGGAANGAQHALYTRPTASNRMSSSGNLAGTGFSLGGAETGPMICCSRDMSQVVFLGIGNNTAKIFSGPISALVQKASISSVNNDVNWEIRYNPSNNTFEVYKAGVLSSLKWVDTTNTINHDSSHQYGGLRIERLLNSNAAAIDNWVLRDWV